MMNSKNKFGEMTEVKIKNKLIDEKLTNKYGKNYKICKEVELTSTQVGYDAIDCKNHEQLYMIIEAQGRKNTIVLHLTEKIDLGSCSTYEDNIKIEIEEISNRKCAEANLEL